MSCARRKALRGTLPSALTEETDVTNRMPAIAASLCLAAACADDSGGTPEPTDVVDVQTGDTGDAGAPDADDARPADSGAPDTGGCVESGGAPLPDDIEWVVFDGVSDELLSFAARPFAPQDTADGGTIDLNDAAVYGGNGFLFDVPVQVVGASVRFTNLTDSPTAVTVQAWPDFGANGFDFAWEAPVATATRCLSSSDDGAWVDVTWPEPIELPAYDHLFVGHARAAVTGDDRGPELMFENVQADEPYFAGVRWPDWDPQATYGGTSSPWYTWQVRLAVRRQPVVEPGEQRFARVEGFRANSRVAFGDFDHDGDDDLMTNGPTLYENQDGVLVDITAAAFPAGVSAQTNGGVWGDLDDDGCVDFVGTGGRDIVLRNNCDGTFTDVTDASGVDDTQNVRDCDGDGQPEHAPTEAAGLFDADGDGDLDLYLANYECTSQFASYQNYPDRLFLNRGDGTFDDGSDRLIDATDAGRGVTPTDLDLDGDVDLFVSNYRLDPNHWYEQRGGDLREDAHQRGLRGVEQQGAYGHTIGTAFGDIDGDGDLDAVHANLAHPRFYHFSDRTVVNINDGYGVFTDEAAERGIRYRETHSSPVLFDADNDGDLDLFITAVYAGRASDMYLNDGTGHFIPANHETGLVIDNGWGAAASDLDNDGDLDVIAYDRFDNRTDDEAHWLQVRPVGVGRNVSAIGAIVEVTAGDRTWVRVVGGGEGTGCQSSFTQHVGLGDVARVDRVVVRFTTGEVVELDAPEVDKRIWVYADGEHGSGWAPPR